MACVNIVKIERISRTIFHEISGTRRNGAMVTLARNARCLGLTTTYAQLAAGDVTLDAGGPCHHFSAPLLKLNPNSCR